MGKFGEALGVAPGNVPVYSCDYSTARDEDFPDRKAYRSYLDGVFMGFKWQCVELARRWLYLNKGYIFEDVAMAYDIFNLRSVTSTVDHTAMPLHAFKNGAKRRPELGCLLIWDEGGEFEVTGHVAIVTEVGDEFIRFAEQNVDNSIWKPGRDYSRELKVKITDEGGYWVEPYYHDASILGWVIQTEDDTYALPPQKFDRSLLNLKVKKVDSASQPTTRWVDTSTAAGKAYVVALGHELVSNPEDFHRYFCLSDTAHQQLKRATNELHYLFLQATNHVLQNDDLLRQFNIPEPIWHKIKRSWENRRHETITGRFDFTVSERGIKVYEYNADSSSCYFESGRLQSEWAQFVGCRVGKCSGEALFEKLVATWKDSEVQGVLHIMQDDDKEESYHALFMQAAMEKAGITTKIIKGVRGLSWKGESVVDDCGVPINWVWKTWAWETALDQIRQQLVEGASGVPLDTGKSPRLVDVLLREQVLVFEPLWTLITSNKAILPVLWSLYPDHPFLLNSGFELTKPLVKGGYVTKPIVGRRGENISIVDHNESIVKEVGGQFGDRDKIYQELAPLPNVCGMNVQVCTFSVGGSYGGACVRVDPSPVITGESDLYPLRFMADKDWLSPAKG
jgi:glutathionylspermidine amidase/synthetase